MSEIIVLDHQSGVAIRGFSGAFVLTSAVCGFIAGYQVAEKTYATAEQIDAQWHRTKLFGGTAAVVLASLYLVGRVLKE
ncbi:hypothetical protein AB1Y20_002779 [Prymnesium parvum]|uniref:Uncharacterized protein n=1 Tax=Prymnesium parvum TaxID=97485 RepID=A0AB34JBS0_PRYPA